LLGSSFQTPITYSVPPIIYVTIPNDYTAEDNSTQNTVTSTSTEQEITISNQAKNLNDLTRINTEKENTIKSQQNIITEQGKTLTQLSININLLENKIKVQNQNIPEDAFNVMTNTAVIILEYLALFVSIILLAYFITYLNGVKKVNQKLKEDEEELKRINSNGNLDANNNKIVVEKPTKFHNLDRGDFDVFANEQNPNVRIEEIQYNSVKSSPSDVNLVNEQNIMSEEKVGGYKF